MNSHKLNPELKDLEALEESSKLELSLLRELLLRMMTNLLLLQQKLQILLIAIVVQKPILILIVVLMRLIHLHLQLNQNSLSQMHIPEFKDQVVQEENSKLELNLLKKQPLRMMKMMNLQLHQPKLQILLTAIVALIPILILIVMLKMILLPQHLLLKKNSSIDHKLRDTA